MAAASKTTGTRTPKVERAQISEPTPKVTPNFSILGLTKDGTSLIIDRVRKTRYKTYYEMYAQHPTLRAGIEKISKVAVTNGYRFTPALSVGCWAYIS